MTIGLCLYPSQQLKDSEVDEKVFGKECILNTSLEYINIISIMFLIVLYYSDRDGLSGTKNIFCTNINYRIGYLSANCGHCSI